MTSVGKTTDPSVNQNSGGPYSLVLRGELIHQAGFVLPLKGKNPTYSQLYIHDNISYNHAIDHRMAIHEGHQRRNGQNHPLDRAIMGLLQDIIHTFHPAIHFYQQAFELTTTLPPDQQCSISLYFDQNSNRRHYNLPEKTVNEIAVVVIGDGERVTGPQDIIIYCIGRISLIILCPFLESLTLILFIHHCAMSFFFQLDRWDGTPGFPTRCWRIREIRQSISFCRNTFAIAFTFALPILSPITFFLLASFFRHTVCL
jgi:hypothetical protein